MRLIFDNFGFKGSSPSTRTNIHFLPVPNQSEFFQTDPVDTGIKDFSDIF